MAQIAVTKMLACASPNELGRQGDEDDCHHAQQGHLQPEVLGKSNFGGVVRTHVHHLPRLFSLYFGCRSLLMRIKWTALLPDGHIIGWSAATIKEQNGGFFVVKF